MCSLFRSIFQHCATGECREVHDYYRSHDQAHLFDHLRDECSDEGNWVTIVGEANTSVRLIVWTYLIRVVVIYSLRSDKGIWSKIWIVVSFVSLHSIIFSSGWEIISVSGKKNHHVKNEHLWLEHNWAILLSSKWIFLSCDKGKYAMRSEYILLV